MGKPECDVSGPRFRALIVGAGDTGLELAQRLVGGWCVTLVDLSSERLEEVRGAAEASGDNYRLVVGDGTSRLVLEEAGAGSADVAVVVANPDAVGLEVCRVLRREFPSLRVVALARQLANVKAFRELGVDALSDSEAEAAAVLGRVEIGSRIAQHVGLGEGEVMETEVLPASSAVGKTLGSFHPKSWLVAAVYRDHQLVVPHGDTVLESGDRLLLVGEPRILPAVATLLRSGVSEFPLHYGAGIGVAMLPGIELVSDELQHLFEGSAAQWVSFLAPREAPETGVGEVARVTRDDRIPAMERPDFRWRKVIGIDSEREDLGLLVLPRQRLGVMRRMGFGDSLLVKRIGSSTVPVLVPKGVAPYRRVVLALPGSQLQGAAATLALDVARRFGLPLVLVTPNPPEIVTGHQHSAAVQAAVQAFSDLATPYRLRFERIQPEGNPVTGLLGAVREGDLMVIGLPAKPRNSWTKPSVAMHLIHRASCSVLVLPDAATGD